MSLEIRMSKIGSSKRRLENFTAKCDLNFDLSNTSGVLHQLSCKADWEQVIRRVLNNPQKIHLLQVASSQSTLYLPNW